jgi:hypothetical protein
MSSCFRRLIVLAGVAALPCAALEWKVLEQSIATAPFQETQDVEFEFKNTGSKPVAILDLQTNCDCLEATGDKGTYAPGETGRIKARFTLGDHAGLYERVITVVTDDADAPTRLKLKIVVPEVFAITPRSVQWPLNHAVTVQTVDLTPAPGLELNFTDAQATNKAFTASLEVVQPGKRYRIAIQPRSTAEPASAAIRVFGRDQAGHPVVASAYATVQ